MAAGIVAGLAAFIFLVLRADRRPPRQAAQEPNPQREVIGGRFDAAGGRQVMPRRDVAPAENPDDGPG